MVWVSSPNFGLIWCMVLEIFQFLDFFRFWQFGSNGRFFCSTFPQMVSLIVLTRLWVEPRHLSHKSWISAARFELSVGRRKKDRTRKKSRKGYISPIWGEAPTEAIYIKNVVVGDILDVTSCAKFQNETSRGYHFTGVEFSIFLLIFKWALQQFSATALLVMSYQFWLPMDFLTSQATK